MHRHTDWRPEDPKPNRLKAVKPEKKYSTTGSHVGKGPKGYRRSDERIREDVCETLTQHPEIDASQIEVVVKDGYVKLSGAVESRHMKRMAEDAIEGLSGITDIKNQLRIVVADQ